MGRRPLRVNPATLETNYRIKELMESTEDSVREISGAYLRLCFRRYAMSVCDTRQLTPACRSVYRLFDKLDWSLERLLEIASQEASGQPLTHLTTERCKQVAAIFASGDARWLLPLPKSELDIINQLIPIIKTRARVKERDKGAPP
jgi:hypothetical protein